MMREIGVEPGDVVEIIGKRRTAATAWPAYAEDSGKNIIRIDRIIRSNAQVDIGDRVIVRRAEIKPAKSVKLAPVGFKISVDPGFLSYVKRRLMEIPLLEGDNVLIPMLGQSLVFNVVLVKPYGVVVVSDETNVVILEKPLKKELKESIVKEVAKLLKEEGYEILHMGEEKGEADIVAERGNRQLLIKIVKEYVKREKDLNFYLALGELLTIMRDPNTDYALVLTDEYRDLAKKIPEQVLQKLNMKILILEKKYMIKELE